MASVPGDPAERGKEGPDEERRGERRRSQRWCHRTRWQDEGGGHGRLQGLSPDSEPRTVGAAFQVQLGAIQGEDTLPRHCGFGLGS